MSEARRVSRDNKQRTEGELDPGRVYLAQRLAKNIIDLDTSILSLIVVDALGRVLHVARSARLPVGEEADAEQVKVFGTISKLILGAANQAAPMMGATEAVVGVFKNQKVLLVNLKQYDLLVGLRLARSSNAEYVCDVIEETLATTGEA